MYYKIEIYSKCGVLSNQTLRNVLCLLAVRSLNSSVLIRLLVLGLLDQGLLDHLSLSRLSDLGLVFLLTGLFSELLALHRVLHISILLLLSWPCPLGSLVHHSYSRLVILLFSIMLIVVSVALSSADPSRFWHYRDAFDLCEVGFHGLL